MATIGDRGIRIIDGGDVISRTPINRNYDIISNWSDFLDDLLAIIPTGTNSLKARNDALIGLSEPLLLMTKISNTSTGILTLEITTNQGDETIDPPVSLGVKKIFDSVGNQLGAGDFIAGRFVLLNYDSTADGGVGGFIVLEVNTLKEITLTFGSPHGFNDSDLIHYNGTTWELANYVAATPKIAHGIVRVLDTNSITIYSSGTLFDGGWITDENSDPISSGPYYASTNTVGRIQAGFSSKASQKILEVHQNGLGNIVEFVIDTHRQEVSNHINNKSNPHNVTLAQLGCPFPVNSIYITVSEDDPVTLWPGTTWEAITSDIFLRNHHSVAPETTGGSSTITEANLPSHNHDIGHSHTGSFSGSALASHTHTFSGSSMNTHGHIFSGSSLSGHTHSRGTMDIIGTVAFLKALTENTIYKESSGAFTTGSRTSSNYRQIQTDASDLGYGLAFQASRNWSGSTSSTSGGTPSGSISETSAGIPSGSNSSVSGGTPSGTVSVSSHTGNSGSVGSGSNFLPKYINCRMWKRLT